MHGSETATAAAAAAEPGVAGRWLARAAWAFAMAGGVTFCLLIAMSIVSIVGRKLAAAPVPGDFELMQMGAAFGAAAFLPYCAMRDHHLKVEILSDWVPARLRYGLEGVAQVLLAAFALLFAWRTALQAIDLRGSGETTTLLAVPMWIPVALLVPSFALLAACAVYRGARSFAVIGRT